MNAAENDVGHQLAPELEMVEDAGTGSSCTPHSRLVVVVAMMALHTDRNLEATHGNTAAQKIDRSEPAIRDRTLHHAVQ